MIKTFKTLFSIIVFGLYAISQVEAQVPQWEWAKRYGGSEGIKKGNSILVDNKNNIYVAGSFYTDLKIENTTITATKFNDLFIAKFNETGNLIWIKSAGGPVGDNAASLTLLDDFLYVLGSFDFQITFENINLQTDLSGSIFLAKYDLDGNLIWVHYIGPGGSGACISYLNITNDKKEYLYLTGCMIHEQVKNITGKSYNDNLFFAKYDTAGNMMWIRQYGGNSIGGGRSIIHSNSGYVFNTGCFKDTVQFGEDPSNQVTMISHGNRDAYISKYDSKGKLIWVKQIGGELADVSNSITTDSVDNIYITGSFYGTADFLDTTLISQGECDAFVLKLDSSGNRKWIKHIGNTGIDFGRFIYLDNTQQLYFIGNFQETISLADTTLTSNSTYEYASNAFISKFSSTGEFVWVKQIGSYWDRIESLVSNGDGAIFSTGSLDYTTVFLDDITLQPKGNADFFVAKINENPSLVVDTNEIFYFKLFPNPTERILNIQINAPRPDNLSLEIYTLTGKLLLKKNFHSSAPEFRGEIDLSNLPVGIYIVIIKGDYVNKIERIIIT